MRCRFIFLVVLMVLCAGCFASGWKIHGGPSECEEMCEKWGLEFTAMVAVGNQDEFAEGATACVCQPKQERRNAALDGAYGSSTSMAGPITAAQAANAAAAAQGANAAAMAATQAANAAAAAQAAQMMQMQQQHHHHYLQYR